MKLAVKRLEWPLLVFVLALLPRLAQLGARPFWLDEVFTLQRVSLQPAALVFNSFYNHHMPSYFLMLRPLLALGDPQFWLRLPSAIFGAMAVMLVFVIARRIAGCLAAVLAALIIGLSPTMVAFGQEARSYTLMMALILVALYGVVRLAQDLPAAEKMLRAPDARAGWLCFILGTAAAADVLADSLPWLLTANLIAAALVVMGKARGAFMRNMLKADLVILILAAPFYAGLEIYQQEAFVKSLGWIPPLDFGRFWYSFGSVFFMHLADSVSFNVLDQPDDVLVWVIDVALVVALVSAVRRLRARPVMLAVLGMSLLLLPVSLTLISFWQPILLPRYILWSAAPFAILAGIGAAVWLEPLARRAQALAVLAIAALLLANMLPYYTTETKPRWDIAAKMLVKDVQPGDVVFLRDRNASKILETYLPAGKRRMVLVKHETSLKRATKAVDEGKRVWAVYGLAGQGSNKAQKRHYKEDQKLFGQPQLVQRAGGRIVIALYGPPLPAGP